MKRGKLAAACSLVVLCIVCFVLYSKFIARDTEPTNLAPSVREKTDEEQIERMAILNAEISRSLRFNQNEAPLLNDPMERSQLSEMALALDDPNIEEREAQTALHSLLASMATTVYRGEFPAGLNVEITNTLLGDNPRKVGYLPMDSPRINDNGELIDKYGTPYWFHSMSSNRLTITSAGPDKRLHTDDDTVYPGSE